MKKIDLTWSGVFGGEGDGSRRSAFEDSGIALIRDRDDRSTHQHMFIRAILDNMTVNAALLLDQTNDKFSDEASYFTMDFFEDLNPRLIQGFFDPYANLGDYCDCCGKRLNLLNRRWFLCETCDDKGDHDNIFNQSTALIMEDLSND